MLFTFIFNFQLDWSPFEKIANYVISFWVDQPFVTHILSWAKLHFVDCPIDLGYRIELPAAGLSLSDSLSLVIVSENHGKPS